MKIYIFILAIYFCASAVIPQKLNFQKIGPEKGLGFSQIFTLAQLDNNLIVVGTLGEGISFFNGAEFITVGIDEGLTNDKILNFAVSPGGELWIATRYGISKYSGAEFTNFTTSHGLSNNIVNYLIITKEGFVYAGTKNGLDVYKPSNTGSVFENILRDKDVLCLYEDAAGSIWAGTQTGLFILTEGVVDSTRYKELIGEKIYTIKGGPENKIYAGTDNGLFLINGDEVKNWDKKSGLRSNIVLDILTTSGGDLWIGTDNGLSRISDGRIRNYGKKEGINNYAVWTILEDHENNIWFGTDEGLYKLISDEFEIFLDSEGNKIDAWYIKRDKWGTLWVGAHQKGVFRMEGGEFQMVEGNTFLEGNSIDYIYQDRSGYLWFCGYNGVARYNGSVIEKFLPASELSQLTVNSVIETENGDMLFGTWESRLYRFSNGRLTYEGEGEYPLTYLEEFRGRIYIATPGDLVYIGEEGPVTPEWAIPLETHDVISILVYNEKQLLLAVYKLGVILASFEDDEIVSLDTISVDDGLNDNSILAMAVDGNSDLWAGTNKGINRIKLSSYKRGEKINVNSFEYDDGIPGSELLQKSMYYDSSGYMWFGTVSGLARFRPNEISERNITADIQFTDFMYTDGGDQFNISPDYLKKRLMGEREIEIPVRESDISVSFAATHFRSPSGLKYRYKINDGSWSHLSRQRNILLPNLSHGSYTLTVEAEGDWNTSIEPASLKFVIPTPFWKMLWFEIILGAGFAALMFWAYRFETAKSRVRQKELEERLKEREKYQETLKRQFKEIKNQKEKAENSDRIKSEFLAQMSHEIRTPLSVILNYTSLLKEMCKDEDELKESFFIIDNSGKRLIRTIESILNMSQIQVGTLETHPKKLDLSDLVKKITEEFKSLADSKNIELNLSLNVDDTTAILDEYTISHLVQNLLDNAIKYTDQGSVNISVDQNSSGKLILEVKDTGIGIAEAYLPDLFSPFSQEDSGYTRKFDGAGLGLSLVKKYCELNSAEIFVESKKEAGSKFTVIFNTRPLKI